MNEKAKWQPFNSVIAGGKLVNEILNVKNLKKMPTLSDDQINEIENKLINSKNNETEIKIKYFKKGKYLKTTSIIKRIDIINKKVILNNDYSIFLTQIIEIQ